VRLISWPLTIEVMSRPTIIGTSSSPELVAPSPLTICRYWGRKTIDPKRARPMMKPAALVMAKTELRNSFSGRMGSTARRSTWRNAPSNTSAARASPRVWADAQGYSFPPQVVSRTMQVTPAPSREAPR